MFLGQFRQKFAPAREEEEPRQVEKPPEQMKSPNSEEFIKTPEAQKFVSRWLTKKKNGEPLYKKRGIVRLLRMMFQVPGLSTNKDVLSASDEILSMLGGMDGLEGFLMGWKIKSEGIIKSLKTIVGGK